VTARTQAPVLSGMLTASMARIEVLPYNHFYDFLLFEFHVATWCIVP
jgi:hypothetical protein